jgi:hypothetical protein
MLCFEAVETIRRQKRIERLSCTKLGRLEWIENRASGSRNDLYVGLTVAIAAEAG